MPIGPLRLEHVCVATAILSFPAALLLIIVTRWVAKFRMLFWTAYMIQVIASIVHYFVGTISGNALIEQGFELRLLVGVVLYFLVSSSAYGLLIKHPETGRIGFPKGMLVTVCLLALAVALALVFIAPTLLVRVLR